MADYDNAAFAPAEGCEREDITKQACEVVFSASRDAASPTPRDRKPYGGRPGKLMSPRMGPGDRSGWESQGYMVQPLKNGFSYPSSRTMIRRDGYELNEKDNFDPAQASAPRVKGEEEDR